MTIQQGNAVYVMGCPKSTSTGFTHIWKKDLDQLRSPPVLRLQPPNFSIISYSLAANLKKVRQTSV